MNIIDFLINKKIVISLFLLISMFFIVYVSFLRMRQREIKTQLEPTQKITASKLELISVSPVENALKVGLSPQINVVFSRGLSSFEQSSITLGASPEIKGKSEWSKDRTTYILTPFEALKTNQKYILTINYADTLFVWQFTTVLDNEVSNQDQIKLQKQADENFAEWQDGIYQNYPWYNSLPLQTKDYFVYFDLKKKSFIVDLYPNKSSNQTVEQQVKQFKNEINSKLKNIGVNISIYKFEFFVHSD